MQSRAWLLLGVLSGCSGSHGGAADEGIDAGFGAQGTPPVADQLSTGAPDTALPRNAEAQAPLPADDALLPGVCEHDGDACDDGLLCTVNDICGGGACSGTLLVCGNGGEQCGVSVCDPRSGRCVFQADDDGGACDDGDACTGGDLCREGRCIGQVDLCRPGGPDAPDTPDGPGTSGSPSTQGDADPAGTAELNPLGIRLTDVTSQVGNWPVGSPRSNLASMGSGAALADFDGDGRLDVALARSDLGVGPILGGPSLLLLNRGPAGSFVRFEADGHFPSLLAGRSVRGLAAGDFDRDGDVDLFAAVDGSDLLLRNDGGSFRDVTEAFGVGGPKTDSSAGALFADLNADGWPDLLVYNQVRSAPIQLDAALANRLYINDGGQRFRPPLELGMGGSHALLVAELDGDPDLELVVANDRFAANGEGGITHIDGDNFWDLVEIDGEGMPHFARRSAERGLDPRPRSSMGIALGDVNADGQEDLYITDWGPNQLLLRRDDAAGYRSGEDYGLAAGNVTPDMLSISWGARFLDLDHDGALELFVVNGAFRAPPPCEEVGQLDRLFRAPSPGAHFADISKDAGLPARTRCAPNAADGNNGRGLLTGDFDGDGDDDFMIATLGVTPRFLRNDTPPTGQHYLRVVPRGTVSAPYPVGAVLLVQRPSGETLRRQLFAGGSPNGQDHPALELGLGDDPVLSEAWLLWPSGHRQRLDTDADFELNRTLRITEPRWLRIEPAVLDAGAAHLVYAPDTGALGSGGMGSEVAFELEDGRTLNTRTLPGGGWEAELPHPGEAGAVSLRLRVDQKLLPLRPRIIFR